MEQTKNMEVWQNKQKEVFKISDPEEYNVAFYTLEQIQELWISKYLLLFTDPKSKSNIELNKKKSLCHQLILVNTNLLSVTIGLGLFLASLSLYLPLGIGTLLECLPVAQEGQEMYSTIILVFICLLFCIGLKYAFSFFIFRLAHDLHTKVNGDFNHAMKYMPSYFVVAVEL